MKKIIAFGASSSKNSINKVFASHAASLIDESESIILDLKEWRCPIGSQELETIV